MPRTYLRNDNYGDSSVSTSKIDNYTILPEDINPNTNFFFKDVTVGDTLDGSILMPGEYFVSGEMTFTGTISLSGANVNDIQLYPNGIIMNKNNNGFKVSLTGGLGVSITGGDFILNEQIRTISDASYTLVADPTLDRIAVIYVDMVEDLIKVKWGVAAADPDYPTLEDTDYVVAYVYITAALATLTDSNVFEQRNESVVGKRMGVSYGSVAHGGTIPLPVADVKSYLAADIGTGDTTITLLSVDDFKSEGYVKIGAETIYYTDKNKTQLLNCTRGAENTTAATHSKFDQVNYSFPASSCTYTISNKFIDIYPVWESSKWECSVDSNRVVTNYAYAATWGGTYAYGPVNYYIRGAY